jgi:hypothetical protein
MAQHIQQVKFIKAQKKCPVGLLGASPHYSFSPPFSRSRLLHKLKPKRSRPKADFFSASRWGFEATNRSSRKEVFGFTCRLIPTAKPDPSAIVETAPDQFPELLG